MVMWLHGGNYADSWFETSLNASTLPKVSILEREVKVKW